MLHCRLADQWLGSYCSFSERKVTFVGFALICSASASEVLLSVLVSVLWLAPRQNSKVSFLAGKLFGHNSYFSDGALRELLRLFERAME